MRFASCLLFVLTIIGLSGCTQCDRCQSPFFDGIFSSLMFQKNVSTDSAICDCLPGSGAQVAGQASDAIAPASHLIHDPATLSTTPVGSILEVAHQSGPETDGSDGQDGCLLSIEQPSDLSAWNSQSQLERSVLEDASATDPEIETEIPQYLNRNQVNEIVAEPAPLNEWMLAPSPEIDEIESFDLDPTPLPATQEIQPLPIVLKARPVERHLLNDRRNQHDDSMPRHVSVADASPFIQTQLRPSDSIRIEVLSELDGSQSDEPLESPGADPDEQPSADDLRLPLKQAPRNDVVTTTTESEATVSDIVLRAWPATDGAVTDVHPTRARIGKHQTAILRLIAITPPDQNVAHPSIASFNMTAPRIVRSHHSGLDKPETEIEPESLQQAVRPSQKAKTQLKTIER